MTQKRLKTWWSRGAIGNVAFALVFRRYSLTQYTSPPINSTSLLSIFTQNWFKCSPRPNMGFGLSARYIPHDEFRLGALSQWAYSTCLRNSPGNPGRSNCEDRLPHLVALFRKGMMGETYTGLVNGQPEVINQKTQWTIRQMTFRMVCNLFWVPNTVGYLDVWLETRNR